MHFLLLLTFQKKISIYLFNKEFRYFVLVWQQAFKAESVSVDQK